MFKKITPLIALFLLQFSFSQSIDVNPTGAPESNFDLTQLVNEVLTDNCSQGENISAAHANGNANNTAINQTGNSFGYFTYTPPAGQVADETNFPFEKGMLLSSGRALDAEGPNNSGNITGEAIGGAANWPGDNDLTEILNEQFGDTRATSNATVLEFDFVPLTDKIEFDYIFASEEWEVSTFECPDAAIQFLDGFAFIITGPGITPDIKTDGTQFAHGGKNIALLRDSSGVLILDASGNTIPVSAGTIFDNNQCNPSQSHPDEYVSQMTGIAQIEYSARTKKQTALETVTPGETYHLKLVIADRGGDTAAPDQAYDSTVFLDSGSFTTAPVLTIGGVEVGEVQPICQGGNGAVTIDGTMNLPGLTGAVTYQWSHQPIGAPAAIDMTIANGYAQDENNAQLTTNVNGTYTLTATLPLSGGACDTVDSATITFLPDTTIATVPDIRACETTVGGGTASFAINTINNNDTVLLNGQAPALYSVSYHANQADADSGANPITPPYVGVSTEIFARVILTADPAFCFATSSFNVIVDTVPTATQPANPIIRICDDLTNGANQESFDLTQFETEILNGQLLTDVSVSYFDNSTTPPTLIPTANVAAYLSGTKTIGVTVSNDANTTCIASTTFEIITDLIPVATQPTEMRACDDEDAATGDIFGEETFDLTTQNETVLGGPVAAGGLDPALYTVSYHWVDNTNPAAPVNIAITTPTAYVLNVPFPAFSQEIFATVTNNINNTCSTTTSFFIFRDAIYTTATPVINLVECDDNNPGDLVEVFNLNAQIQTILGSGGVTPAEATVTFYTTEADAIANTVANAISIADASNYTSNTNITTGGQNPQTIHYTISNNNNITCFSTGSLTLQVDALPNIVAPTTAFKACDLGTIDGYTEFNFISTTALAIINEITQNNTTYAVSFFASVNDAQNNTNELPTVYTNTTQNAQTIHVKVVDTITGCATYTTLNLEVVTAPQAFPFTNPLTYCDTDNDTFGYFDLNSIVLDLTGNIPGVIVEFFETEEEANFSATNTSVGVIPTDVLYENVDTDGDGTGSTQTIYAQLSINGLDCVTLVEVNLVVINSPELPSIDLVYAQCETVDDPLTDPFNESLDGFVSFDLTSYELTHLYTEIIAAGGDPAEYTATYYEELDASGNPVLGSIIPNPNGYTNEETPNQVIYVSVAHTGSVAVPATGCSTIKAITLHVDLLPTANYTPIEVCDDNDVNDPNNNTSDGQISFNLTDYISLITDGATGVDVEFYTTEVAAEAGLGAATIPSANFIATPTAYENAINPQAIFARVFNPSTGCYAVAIVALHVNPNPTPLSNQQIVDTLGNQGVMEECDGNVDGSGDISEQIATFDLTQWETAILNGEDGVSAVYYASVGDAAAGVNAITNPATYNNIANPQTIYVSVVNDGFGINPVTNGTGCTTVVTFQLYVPVPTVQVFPSATVICIDANGVPLTDIALPVLTATAGPSPAAAYNYQWSLNGSEIPGATNQTYSVTQPGDYTVTVSGPTDYDCINTSSAVTIEVSGVPDNFDANVTTNAFAESHQIVATATSTIPGIEFWYSLDGAEATTNGTFDNVSPGIHVVTITDGKNCWKHNITVPIIDYPHFFTPNGDGINDTWAIIGQEGIPISQIYIFDRFGKLLSQLDPDGAGWDGAYNGNQMPASDYWFKIIYIEGNDSSQKELKAHFSLKR